MSDEMSGAVGGAAAPATSNGSGAAAPSGGPNFAVPGNASPNAPDADTGDDSAADGGEAKAAKKPKAQAFKLKRGGAEVDATIEDLQQWASDDYEHTVKIDGEERKLKYPDLVRNASLGGAALKRMQQAAEMQKKFTQERQEFLRDRDRYFAEAGEDPYEWAVSQVKQEMQLQQLRQSDPDAYIEQMQARKAKQAELKAGFERQRAEAQAKQQQAAEARKALFAAVPAELERMGAGKYNQTMHGIVSQLHQQAERAGARLDPSQLAGLARDQFQSDLRAAVADMDAGQLEQLLGPEAIKRLRKGQLEAAKAADKAKMLDGDAPKGKQPLARSTGQPQGKTVAQILAEKTWRQ